MDEVQRYRQLRKVLEDEAEAERLQEAGAFGGYATGHTSAASVAAARDGGGGGDDEEEDEQEEEEEEEETRRGGGGDQRAASREQIEGFKKEVREWMDLDIVIKNLSGMLKDRRAHKKELTDRIVRFMNVHNIDDLDTREGSIRSRVSFVKPPLSQRMIRESLHAYFEHNEAVATQVLNSVFNRGREKVERASLRLKPPGKDRQRMLLTSSS
jgi:hypothetical protein